jgi:hypothetical protein
MMPDTNHSLPDNPYSPTSINETSLVKKDWSILLQFHVIIAICLVIAAVFGQSQLHVNPFAFFVVAFIVLLILMRLFNKLSFGTKVALVVHWCPTPVVCYTWLAFLLAGIAQSDLRSQSAVASSDAIVVSLAVIPCHLSLPYFHCKQLSKRHVVAYWLILGAVQQGVLYLMPHIS